MAGKPSIWAKGQAIVKAITLSDQTVAEGVAIVDADGNQITSFGGSAGLTDAQLRATPVPVSGSVTAVTGGLTDTQLRATPVPVSGTVTASGPLTDTQLRNTAVPVSGTFFQGTQPVSGPLTDTQLRATPVPVSGSVTASVGTVPVTDNGGSLTVDAPVATPVFVRLSDGAAAVSTLPVSFSESATAAEAGALPALEKVVSGYDRGTAMVRALSMATINGDYRLMVDDARLKKQINQTNLLLMEIVDLLKEQRTK